MTMIDETHDPALRSWVKTANGHPDFPIQNLPLGVFSISAGEPGIGVAIGDSILDLKTLSATELLDPRWRLALSLGHLNAWFAHVCLYDEGRWYGMTQPDFIGCTEKAWRSARPQMVGAIFRARQLAYRR